MTPDTSRQHAVLSQFGIDRERLPMVIDPHNLMRHDEEDPALAFSESGRVAPSPDFELPAKTAACSWAAFLHRACVAQESTFSGEYRER